RRRTRTATRPCSSCAACPVRREWRCRSTRTAASSRRSTCGRHRRMSEARLGPEDAGRTVTVAAGDPVVLALPETPGTGYTWEVEEIPPGARVLEERYERPADAGIGAQSQHVFVVAAGCGG